MSTVAVTHIHPTRGDRTARPQAPARSGSGHVRLTRRGRVVVWLMALGLLLGVVLVFGAGSVATERPGTPEPTRVVMVDEGDTLWGLAADVTTDGDVRAMVERIQRLNALDSALVQVGQKLRVPVSE